MNNANNNLNLLPIFSIILEELSLTRAAARLGISQPALSHSLARLREEFSDPLFVRVPGGLAATPRALELKPRIRQLQESLSEIYKSDRHTSPADFSGRITIATTSYFEQIVIRRLTECLAKQAPRVQLVTHNLATESESLPRQQLERGEIDLAIAGFFTSPPEGFLRKTLFVDPFCVSARKGHPYFKSKQRPEDLCRYPHVMISLRGDLHGRIDDELKKKGLKREIYAGLGNFLTPALLLPDSDSLLVCPTRLAQSYTEFLSIDHRPVPLEIKPVTMQMIWHERLRKDPMQLWIREKLRSFFNGA
jgi:DNA-binding transcriptional LysR family regulator